MLESPLQPVDRGWAWIIALAGMASCCIALGMAKMLGIILVEVERLFGASSQEIAIIVGLRSFSTSIASIFVMGIITDVIHLRFIIMTSGILLCISYSLLYAASSIYYVMAASSISGLALAMLWAPCMVMVGLYFRKHHALSNAIVTAGASLGTIICPYIINALIETFAFNGAMFIIGAASLQIFSLGALMRPPEFYPQPVKDGIQEQLIGDDVNVLEQDIELEITVNGDCGKANSFNDIRVSHTIDNTNTDINADDQCRPKMYDRTTMLRNETNLVVRSNPDIRMSSSKHLKTTDCEVDIQKSMLSLYSENLGDTTKSMDVHLVTENVPSDLETPQTMRREYHFFFRNRDVGKKLKIFDMDLLKDAAFCFFILASSCHFAALILCVAYIPLYLKEHLDSLDDIAVMLSVYGAVELITRFGFGFLGDLVGPAHRYKILSAVVITQGVLINCLRLFTGYGSLITFSVFCGAVHSSYTVLSPCVLFDFFGHGVHSRSLGIVILLRGILVVSVAQVIGYMRKETGSYSSTFNLIGSISILSGLSWLCITAPMIHRRKKREHSKTNGNVTDRLT